MKNISKDETAILEPLYMLVGAVIIGLVVLALWLMNMLWFAAAGLLFFFGALILLQGTPLRGWLGIAVGSIILVISLAIELLMG